MDHPAEQYLRQDQPPITEDNVIQALDRDAEVPGARGAALEEILAHSESVAQRLKEHSQRSQRRGHLPMLWASGGVSSLSSRHGPMPTLSLTLNAVPILDMLANRRRWSTRAGLDRARETGFDPDREGRAEGRCRWAWGELLESLSDAAFYHNKVCSAVHFAHRCLPLVRGLESRSRRRRAAIDAVMLTRAQLGAWSSIDLGFGICRPVILLLRDRAHRFLAAHFDQHNQQASILGHVVVSVVCRRSVLVFTSRPPSSRHLALIVPSPSGVLMADFLLLVVRVCSRLSA